MQTEQAFPFQSVFPSWYVNALGRFLSLQADGFALTFSSTTITVPAGASDQAAVIAVEGLWRYSEQPVVRAHPGGAAGTYPIFVTASANQLNGTTDDTNYAFALAIAQPGSTPVIVAGTVDVFRQVGTCEWDGAEITSVTQTVPMLPGTVSVNDPRLSDERVPEPHAASHASAGDDAVTPAAIGTMTTQQIMNAINAAITAGAVGAASSAIYLPGDLIYTGGATRSGALLCNGQAVSRTTYAALFGAIGTVYGAGDGSTTFNVPNFLSRVVLGAGNGAGLTNRPAGSTGGEEAHLLVAAEGATNGNGVTGAENVAHSHAFSGATGTDSPDHAHSITNSYPINIQGGNGGAFTFFGNGVTEDTGGASARHAHAFSGGTGTESANHEHALAARNADSAHNTMPPFGAAYVWIKT